MRFFWSTKKDTELAFHSHERANDVKKHYYNVFADLITFRNGGNFSDSVI